MNITQQLFDTAFNNGGVPYPDDCAKIVGIAANRLNLTLTPKQADEVWDWWSGRACAGWLFVDDEDEVVRAITSFVRHRLDSTVEGEDA